MQTSKLPTSFLKELETFSAEELSYVIGAAQMQMLKLIQNQREIVEKVAEEPLQQAAAVVVEEPIFIPLQMDISEEASEEVVASEEVQKAPKQALNKVDTKVAKKKPQPKFDGRRPHRLTLADFFESLPEKFDTTCVVLQRYKTEVSSRTARQVLMNELSQLFQKKTKKLVKRLFFVEKKGSFTGTVFIYCFSTEDGHKVRKFFMEKGESAFFRKIVE